MRGRMLRTGLAMAAFSVAMAAPAAAHGGNSDEDTDVTSLPVGKTVTTPTVGGLWSCQSNFNQNAPGAMTQGPWFNGDGTWDVTKKYTVDGDVEWPNAELTITKENDKRIISSNGLPTDHTTGEFPIAPTDDAYTVDRNPSSIKERNVVLELDATPELADAPSCVGGEVGILKSGVVLFNSIDAGGRDAVAYEVQDDCDGHPNQSGYHYHSASDCVLDDLDSGSGQSKLIGWAFDGFGIYGPRDADGKELTSEDLDECHGITSRVKFNGKWQKMYHYVATVDYPYTVGCFRGTSAIRGPATAGGAAQTGGTTGQQGGAPTGQQGPPAGGPPSGPPPGRP